MLPVPEYVRRSDYFRPMLALCDDVFLTADEVASRWRYATQYVNNMRRNRRGPAFLKLGSNGAIRYRLRDVLAYEIDGQCRTLTQERVAAAIASFPGLDPTKAAELAAHVRAVTEGVA